MSNSDDSQIRPPARLFAVGERPLDVLVIGGGVVGAGVARDAALRGLAVGLVEQFDFAAGTSSRTSRLLHGGLRYLAQGHIGLVREASLEKTVIQRIAPHLAQPLPFLFPTRRGTAAGKLKLRLGVAVYDLLCGGENFGHSTGLSQSEILQRLPGLDPTDLTGAVRYFDGLTSDARLVLDTLRSAAAHGARLANYMRFCDARSEGRFWNCQVRDELSGEEHTIAARAVVSATGPWSDTLRHNSTRLRLTKGVHLVIDRTRLAIDEAVVMAEGERILFAIPWGERVILGTTDTDYRGPRDSPRCERADLEYVLRVTNATFPTARLRAADVRSTWAGLRPLVADDGNSPSDISRRHEIRQSEPHWWNVAGGKLTTHRLMAEQTVDQVVRELDLNSLPCRTAVGPLLPVEQTAGISGIIPLEPSAALVEHFCAREWAVHLDDVMIRRSGWHYYLADPGATAVQVAGWMAAALGWDRARIDSELDRYRQIAHKPWVAPRIIGHRGASHEAPENTRASFRLALAEGADGIEGDFHLTRDGQIVCIHDRSMRRTAGVDLVVADSTLAELRTLDIGSWKDARYAGERILTLEEVLTEVPADKHVLIEIKCGPEIIAPLRSIVLACSLPPEQVTIMSFHPGVVHAAQRELPAYRILQLIQYERNPESGAWAPTTDDILTLLNYSGARGIGTQANRDAIPATLPPALRAAGFELHTWTIDDVLLAEHFRTLGVESITTNIPGYLRTWVEAIPK